MKTATFSVEAGAILNEVIRYFQAGADTDSLGLVQGLKMIRSGLADIALLALELDDDRLLAVCQRLNIIRPIQADAPAEVAAAHKEG